jgi:hypothetical protein
MQCSCCRSKARICGIFPVATDDRNRKTIQTFHLCAICRIVYMIKPTHFCAPAKHAAPGRQVA